MEVKNSYAVPHHESGGQARAYRSVPAATAEQPPAQIALDIEYHHQLLQLNTRVSPKDVLVGWYSTGARITETDALLHVRSQLSRSKRPRSPLATLQEFYSRECSSPVHLAFDTSFSSPSAAVRAWVGAPVSLRDTVVGTSFLQIPVVFSFADAQRVGVPLLAATQPTALPGETAGLALAVRRLHSLLELAHAYAQGVVDGRLKADAELGRLLAAAVAAVPRTSKAELESLFGDAIQDCLLVMYLSSLTRTQLQLADKLNTPALNS